MHFQVKKFISHTNPFSTNLYYYNVICHQLMRVSTNGNDNHANHLSNNHKNQIAFGHFMLYNYYTVLAVRYFITGLLIRSINYADNSYFHLDIVMRAVAQQTRFDTVAFMLLSLMVFFGIAIHYITNHCIDFQIADHYHSLIVNNLSQFQLQNRTKFNMNYASQNLLGNWIRLFRIAISMVIKDYRDSRGLSPLTYYSLAEVVIRVRVLVRYFIIELVNIIFVMLLRKCFTMFYFTQHCLL